jgi:hypothetical protein
MLSLGIKDLNANKNINGSDEGRRKQKSAVTGDDKRAAGGKRVTSVHLAS